jgi:ornithine decarboxylase
MYAVKANPSHYILEAIRKAGIRNFDTASLQEIALVKGKFEDAQTHLMNPSKSRIALGEAYKRYGTRVFSLDCEAELEKIAEVIDADRSAVQIFVRLAVSGDHSTFDLSSKFGADKGHAVRLLRSIDKLGFTAGISFHVGSQCLSSQAYVNAITACSDVIVDAGTKVEAIDVGGGFPGFYADQATPRVEEMLRSIEVIFEALPVVSGLRKLCEPGRAIVASAVTLVTRVHLRKDNSLYLNDGIYGSLLGATLGLKYNVRCVYAERKRSSKFEAFTIFGPTCDSLDKLKHYYELPADIKEGDWVVFENLGAYGSGLRTGFNGFYPEQIVVVQ